MLEQSKPKNLETRLLVIQLI